MPLAPGTLLNNRYRIVTILGQGGMGAVYRAHDEHLLIDVAVKENLFLTEEYGRQFTREAHILAGLRHPNLPHVSDYFALDNHGQYLVMDYVKGEDLRRRMERMPKLPEREATLIGISICDALTYLHTRQPPIIHRDIKPGNIKVTPDGQAVLVDFGLAKIMEGSQATSTGARAMTPGYSPPEQYGTARTDARSDIYSLGATLYATLTGIIPEDGIQRITGKAGLVPVRELVPDVSPKMAETIEKALEVDPDNRFQSAEEFKASMIESGELASFYKNRPTITPPPISIPTSDTSEELPLSGQPENAGGSPDGQSQKPLANRAGWLALPAAAALVLILFFLLLLNPDFSKGVLAAISGTTPTNRPTQISSAGVSPTPNSAVALSGTPTQTSTSSGLEGTAVQPPASAETATPTITPTAAPTSTPMGGGPGQIAFASDRGGNMQIWLMDVTTKKTRPLTGLQDGACQPTWAPDGMRLAFISPCPDRQEEYPGSNIFTMNVDAAGNPARESIKPVTSSLEGEFDPAWSPDGKRIAYTTLRKGKPAISVINLETGLIQELSATQSVDKQPAWAPSGLRLAYVHQSLYTSQIWTMSDDGQVQNQYSPLSPVNNLWPAWSTDEQIIFYSQFSSGPEGRADAPYLVYLSYEDRTLFKESRIPTNPKSDIGPIRGAKPSPDGNWLVYEGWPDGKNHDIYIMNKNGSNRIQLTTDPGKDFGPVFRPVPPQQ